MQFLTVQEVAKALNMSEGQVRRLIAAGRLAGMDIGSGGRRHWRVPLEAVTQAMRGVGMVAGTPPPPTATATAATTGVSSSS